MIKSMTAFGRHAEVVNGKNIIAELKSVNNRYFDCSVKISRSYSFLEERIKPYLQAHGVSRGKVEVSITVEPMGSTEFSISLNEGYARAYYSALCELRDTLGIGGEITLASLQRDPNIFTVSKLAEDEEQDWADVECVLSAALEKFLAAREREGANIESDLRAKVTEIGKMVDLVEAHSTENIAAYRSRLEEKLRAVLSDNKITLDESRILTECAIFADKVAIDEEIVRLRSHFTAFEDILSSSEPAGRKLDFLMQEMNREANTIGSKCSDSSIAHTVVNIKCELEKIREQIQNIE